MQTEKPDMPETTILSGAKNIFIQIKDSGEHFDLDIKQIDLYKKAQDIEQKKSGFIPAKSWRDNRQDPERCFSETDRRREKALFSIGQYNRACLQAEAVAWERRIFSLGRILKVAYINECFNSPTLISSGNPGRAATIISWPVGNSGVSISLFKNKSETMFWFSTLLFNSPVVVTALSSVACVIRPAGFEPATFGLGKQLVDFVSSYHFISYMPATIYDITNAPHALHAMYVPAIVVLI